MRQTEEEISIPFGKFTEGQCGLVIMVPDTLVLFLSQPVAQNWSFEELYIGNLHSKHFIFPALGHVMLYFSPLLFDLRMTLSTHSVFLQWMFPNVSVQQYP